MEDVMDKVVAEIRTFSETPSDAGGCSDLLTIEAVYWGDPGVLPSAMYPGFTVQPVRDRPDKETTGYEVRNLELLITLLVDSRVYWDTVPDEATADRVMVQTMENLRRWFRRTSNRSLDGLTGVRDVTVATTDYLVQVRGAIVAKTAQITLTVNQQFQRQA